VNEQIETYLQRGLENETLHHTLLFSGPKRVELAEMLILKIIGRRADHPDLHIYQPEGKAGLHSIESVRALIEEIHKPPFEASRKLFLIHSAERMLLASANALLKTLEEPELDSTILLLSEKPELLLPTLVSRCVHLASHASQEETSRSQAETIFLNALNGKILRFQALDELEKLWSELEGFELQRTVQQLFSIYLLWARENDQMERALSKITQVQLALERNVKWSSCLYQLMF